MSILPTQEPSYTIKEILIQYLPGYLNDPGRRFHLTDEHLHVLNTIICCQTARLGLYYFGCDCCGDTHLLPRSCKHRFCSNCGTSETMCWIRKTSLKLPDIKHYHIVFTLPIELRALCKRNKTIVYNLLFRNSQRTIKEFFDKRYSLLPGIISVLHTNGSDLKYHPHIHQIVSSGGLNKSGEVKELDGDYLVSQRQLADRFRDLFLKGLKDLLGKNLLKFPGHQNTATSLVRIFKRLEKKQWIVNIEAPLHGVEKVIAYVGRYTKKSCISERRIKSIADGKITLSYKDYKNGVRGEKPPENTITLTVTQFLDRLLEHIPEKGFKVVRYYGLYAGINLKKIPESMKVSRLNIAEYDVEEMEDSEIALCPFKKYRQQVFHRTGKDPLYCYACEQTMKLMEVHYVKDGQLTIVNLYDSG